MGGYPAFINIQESAPTLFTIQLIYCSCFRWGLFFKRVWRHQEKETPRGIPPRAAVRAGRSLNPDLDTPLAAPKRATNADHLGSDWEAVRRQSRHRATPYR